MSAPIGCQIEITNACPNNCLHCYNHWRKNTDKYVQETALSVDDATVIMRKLIPMKLFRIVLTGGEPLSNPDVLFKIAQMSNDAGVEVSLNSTLIGLTAEIAAMINMSGVRGIQTSIMGPNNLIHDHIAQNSDALSETLHGISVAISAGIRVSVNMVVTKLNIDKIFETGKLVRSLGIKSFSVTKAGCPTNCSYFDELALSKEEFALYIDELHKCKKLLGLSTDYLEAYPLCGIGESQIRILPRLRKCLAGITTMTIGSSGDVRPCSHADVSYGNILTEDIQLVWDRMNAEWSSGALIPYICKRCTLLGKYCGGGCRMAAKTSKSANIAGMDPYSSPSRSKKVLQAILDSNVDNVPNYVHVVGNSFKLHHGIRIRHENFGAVVSTPGKSIVFLNHAGTKVLLQLERGVVYQHPFLNVDFGKINPDHFLGLLLKSGIITVPKT